LRERGRGGGSSKGEAGLVGDTARLRKGLFEERFNDNPAARWSKWATDPNKSAIRFGSDEQVRPLGGLHANDDADGNLKQQSL